MKPMRRLFVSLGAPIVLVLGLGVAWGVRKGSDIVRQVEAWADALEHSPQPVEMDVAGLPIVSTMYVDGNKVGKVDRIVVLRHEAGQVDSVHVLAEVDSNQLDHLTACNLQFEPDAMDNRFPLEGWKHVMRCADDAAGFVPFGTVEFAGTGDRIQLLMDRADLPCEHMGDAEVCANLDRLRSDMRRLGEQIRIDARRIREEVRSNVRVKVKP